MDIKTIFLYSLTDQLIYIEMPKSIKTYKKRDIVYILFKAFYNLNKLSQLLYKQL